MRKTRILTLLAGAALSLATLVSAAPVLAGGNGNGRGYGSGHGVKPGPGPHGWYGGHGRPAPYYGRPGYCAPRGWYGNGYAWGARWRAPYPGWRPARVWVDGRWVLPPWPGAAWQAGFTGPGGIWIAGSWR